MKNLLVILAILGIAGCASTTEVKEEAPQKPKIKNVILMIGDGMGLSQVSSAFYFKGEQPNFSRFQTVGLINTSPTNVKITDSAAGATAFSTGEKSYNGAIAVNSDTMALPTINEVLFDQGWKTGVIATSSITHATPASFYAHVKYRRMEDEIAAQLITSNIHFAAGGGKEYFSGNLEGRNTFEKLQEAGFLLDTVNISGQLNADSRYAYLLADDGMPRMLDGRGSFLGDVTSKALEYFSLSDNPFFLMIEGSQIDWGGHANDAEYLQTELIDFDNVIGSVLDFADQDGETLVIVTADHETGGYTLASNDGDYDDIKGSFSTGGHSTTLIPVFAYGPGAERFGGIYQNNEIFHKIMDLVKE
jgi:alkaline phosphatase